MKGIDFVGDQSTDGWMNDIKIHIKRYGVRMWTGFRWLKMGDAM
jgi:hypothetical protein